MRRVGRISTLSEMYSGDQVDITEEPEPAAPLSKMSRRDFMKATSAAGLLTAAGVATLSAKGSGLKEVVARIAPSTSAAAAASAWPQFGPYPYTGASQVLDIFVQRNNNYIFGLAGSAEREMYDAFARDEYKDKLTFIETGYELGAFMMAVGYAKAAERAAVALFHVAVGAPAASLGFLQAMDANVPIWAWCSGQTGTTEAADWEERGYGNPRAQEFVREYTKLTYEIVDQTQLIDIVNDGFRVAETAPQGVVFFSQPQALLETPIAGTSISNGQIVGKPTLPDLSASQANMVGANPDDVRLIANKLANANNPWIVTSRAGRFKFNVAKLVQLAETLGAGVVESGNCYMNFPTNHACHQGYSTSVMKNADVVLMIDAFSASVPANAWVAHVLDNPNYISDTADIGLFADSRVFLPQLLGELAFDASSASDRMANLAASHDAMVAAWQAAATPHMNEYPPSHYRIWTEINKDLGAKDILVFGKGFAQAGVANQFVSRTVPGSFYTNDGAAMGFVGTAIGIQLADASKRVLCVMGDWEAHESTLQELLYTCAHHNIPVRWVVEDNQSGFTVRSSHWGLKKCIYDYSFTNNPRFWTVELDSPRTDWAKLATACGVPAKYVDKPDDIAAALAWSKAQTGSSLLSINSQCATTFTPGLSPTRDKQP